ncbi:uncharacterized protein LOC115594287 isoform X3 [Sparus aurata]|uniref:uncharacterized protein LOC115594287 isoform X3 n=1 Tax=Sparus aurata TaxID=8175 RepID=UPI0011C1C0B8|nr:uncharacterized protein LOC115594287 isoform X3 [Sparus aurata]
MSLNDSIRCEDIYPHGAPGGTTLTPDEEKVLSIIRKTASEGISGGIDVQGDEGLSESEDEEEPSGSGAGTCMPPGEIDPHNRALSLCANQQGPVSACGEA